MPYITGNAGDYLSRLHQLGYETGAYAAFQQEYVNYADNMGANWSAKAQKELTAHAERIGGILLPTIVMGEYVDQTPLPITVTVPFDNPVVYGASVEFQYMCTWMDPTPVWTAFSPTEAEWATYGVTQRALDEGSHSWSIVITPTRAGDDSGVIRARFVRGASKGNWSAVNDQTAIGVLTWVI
jgi:hypothetical protein